PWQFLPPNDSITVIVKGTFDLMHGGKARARPESDLTTGDVHHDDDPERSLVYPSDFAIQKPKADVTLKGHAHALNGPATVLHATFRFGDKKTNGFERSIAIIGDRTWQKSVVATAPSDPKPFTSMPLVYERAFGGPAFPGNPAGRGHKGAG